MSLRASAALTVLLIGLASSAGPALAQFYPPPQAVQPPYRPLPPVEADDDDDMIPPYDPPPAYRRAPAPQGTYLPPPRGNEPVYGAPDPQYGPPGQQYGRGPAYPPDVEPYPPPPAAVYREPPQGYEPDARTQPQRPEFALPNPLDILRPPGSIGPGGPGAAPPNPDAVYASLPPEERPETGPAKQLPARFQRTTVDYRTREPAGTLVIDTQNTYLYLVLGNGKAMRYGIGVGRDGFTWAGAERVSRMAEWPDWHPPSEMIERQPYLPRFMAGGPGNPLGARALYLGKTLYRIHGTNQPSTIGSFVSSGCIRLTNDDITDLYYRVNVGTRVVVLPGRAPATANAAPAGARAEDTPPGPYNPLAPPRGR
ncbi:MAG: hypothetical protein QOG83_2307 [Alphaproteobacteria bacterium]|nr:hypothetical protein [Alphaproteobacteria bacterium]